MHAEHQDASARLVRSHATNEVQARKHAALHAEIDDDHVRTVATEKPVAGGHVACLQHELDAGFFQHVPQPLQHDRMVINDQSARHTGRSSYEKIFHGTCTRCDPSCAGTVRAFSNIIHLCFIREFYIYKMLRADRTLAQCPLRRSPKMWAARPGPWQRMSEAWYTPPVAQRR